MLLSESYGEATVEGRWKLQLLPSLRVWSSVALFSWAGTVMGSPALDPLEPGWHAGSKWDRLPETVFLTALL